MNDKYLVTLTIRSVYEGQLEETIRVMIKAFQDIKDLFRKREKRGLQRWCFKGIRNIECTYSPVLNAYHPHFHLIVEGKDAANALIIEWLDSVDIIIEIHYGYSQLDFNFFKAYINEERTDVNVIGRNEATQQAIIKANEIYNNLNTKKNEK